MNNPVNPPYKGPRKAAIIASSSAARGVTGNLPSGLAFMHPDTAVQVNASALSAHGMPSSVPLLPVNNEQFAQVDAALAGARQTIYELQLKLQEAYNDTQYAIEQEQRRTREAVAFALSEERRHTEQKVHTLEEQLTAQFRQYNNMHAAHASANARLQQREEELRTTKRQLQELLEQHDAQNQLIHQAENRHHELIAQYGRTQHELRDLQEANQQLRHQRRITEEHVQEATTEISLLTHTQRRLQEELNSLRQQLETYNAQKIIIMSLIHTIICYNMLYAGWHSKKQDSLIVPLLLTTIAIGSISYFLYKSSTAVQKHTSIGIGLYAVSFFIGFHGRKKINELVAQIVSTKGKHHES